MKKMEEKLEEAQAEITRLKDSLNRTREQKHQLLRTATEALQARKDLEAENERLRASIEELCMKSGKKVQALHEELAMIKREANRLREDKTRAEARLVSEEKMAARAQTQLSLLTARFAESRGEENYAPTRNNHIDANTKTSTAHFSIRKPLGNTENKSAHLPLYRNFGMLYDGREDDRQAQSTSPTRNSKIQHHRHHGSSQMTGHLPTVPSPPRSRRQSASMPIGTPYGDQSGESCKKTSSWRNSLDDVNNDNDDRRVGNQTWHLHTMNGRGSEKSQSAYQGGRQPVRRSMDDILGTSYGQTTSSNRHKPMMSPVSPFSLKRELENSFPFEDNLRSEILEIEHTSKLGILQGDFSMPHSLFISQPHAGEDECSKLLGEFLVSIRALQSGHVVNVRLSTILNSSERVVDDVRRCCVTAHQGVLLIHDASLLLLEEIDILPDERQKDSENHHNRNLHEPPPHTEVIKAVVDEFLSVMLRGDVLVILVVSPSKIVPFANSWPHLISSVGHVIHFQ